MSTTDSPSSLSLADLAGLTKADRNRAVDLYRALAMVVVTLGHWAAIAIGVDAAGGLVGGNALEHSPGLAWLSWVFQVMPLFFVVGGFSSAMSLDAHNADGGSPQDWIASRLRRMVTPAVVLAATWLVLLVAGTAIGLGGLIALAAAAAAIPLWFLANYTIDTALAPYILPRFRQNPALVATMGLGAFAVIEALRLSGVGHVGYLNWVLGWLIFQVAGFAWRDHLLPTGGRLAAWACGFWLAALAAVTYGPWPMAMVHVPGHENSPTHPPSLALLLFGAAYSATALLVAPAVSRWLARAPKAWAAVVAANSMAMSIYLWHLTAAVIAGAGFYAFGALPTAAVGTSGWWLQKLPMIAMAAMVLAGIVAIVARYERRALLAPRQPWTGGARSMIAVAAAISASFKLWGSNNALAIVAGTALLAALWATTLRTRPGRDRLETQASR